VDCVEPLTKSYSARDLKLLMKGIEPLQKTKTVLLSLSLNDHKLLSAAILKHGALPQATVVVTVLTGLAGSFAQSIFGI